MNENYKTGVGLLDVIGVVFIVLKCLGLTSLSWLWVLCPFWIQIAIGVVIGLILCITSAVKSRKANRSFDRW